MSLLAFLPPPSLHFLTPFPLRPFADSSPRLLSFHSCPFHPSWAGWLLWHPLVIPTRYFPDSFASSHHFGGRAVPPMAGSDGGCSMDWTRKASVALTGQPECPWHSWVQWGPYRDPNKLCDNPAQIDKMEVPTYRGRKW